ncbi:Unannotated [Lentimonas sp. CC19]|nr:Unannotated [Lentimonas sp. CC4]CAA6686929.1 Unannotated [Lentimonas sp. CC6]CAA6690112.1 Unannotated [Lentimonas sp. CC19]CAA6690926.1 Unannotated [Lentimonas sp. CC10]CAA7070722.1 Unannotated [Lentimonas sp. CC11]CAA7169249.1 Unannotated [Lentimonas sp. CC21]CAA7180353.1 Unannotated [Lentimonas sp. CC8]
MRFRLCNGFDHINMSLFTVVNRMWCSRYPHMGIASQGENTEKKKFLLNIG